MLPLFCSRLQLVIVTVSDQKIKQNKENVMCSWYLPWQTLEVSGIAKKKISRMRMLYINTAPSSLSLHFSQNKMLPTVPFFLK